jgi:murein DD-endopeptidase MepM/ murein hydrolase activator NlpD
MKFRLASFVILAVAFSSFLSVPDLSAQGVTELQSKIEEQNRKLAELEKEIATFQGQLDTLGKQKQTLQQAIQTLDVSRKKISTNILITENKIAAADLEIQRLALDIGDRETRIDKSGDLIGKTIREVHAEGSYTLIERVLSEATFQEAWTKVDTLTRFQAALGEHVHTLEVDRDELSVAKSSHEQIKDELSFLRKDLRGQQGTLDATRTEQNQLLQSTKNQESTYQKLLKEKQEARAAFEKSLREYESQLQFALDPSKLPATGKGILSWPLDSVRVTQNFGNTAFATANPQIYNGGGHNGIDLAASIGTRVKSSLSGTVLGTGNTDLQKGCYSYGKWVLIKHGNGLSTLYAHLSTISVVAGQEIKTGEVLGYSGNTGYSTGPHLHYTVFSSDGVRIMKLGEYRKSTNCGNVQIPVAPLGAYLNPLSYL